MKSTLALLAWPATALVLYWISTLIVTRYRRASFKKRHGVEYTPTYPHSDILAVGDLRDVNRAHEAGTVMQLWVDRLDRACKKEGRSILTYDAHIMRNWIMFTADPKNVQAVLATQFKDFALGPLRHGVLSPL